MDAEDEDKADAKYENGVLTLTLPKKASSANKRTKNWGPLSWRNTVADTVQAVGKPATRAAHISMRPVASAMPHARDRLRAEWARRPGRTSAAT